MYQVHFLQMPAYNRVKTLRGNRYGHKKDYWSDIIFYCHWYAAYGNCTQPVHRAHYHCTFTIRRIYLFLRRLRLCRIIACANTQLIIRQNLKKGF